MQKVAFLALFLILGTFAHSFDSNEQMRNLWSSWKLQFNKEYVSLQEDAVRFGIFLANYKFILEWNAANHTSTLGLNQFSDLTTEEFSALYTGAGAIPEEEIMSNLGDVAMVGAPSSWDWRAQGKVTQVKNQGQCGSCWAFATVATLESLYAIQGKGLNLFSEQQLVDCVKTCHGCNGGLPSLAYKYTQASGIELGSTYPYTARTGTCKYSSSAAHAVNKGFAFVTPKNANLLMNAIYQVPVSLGIQANQPVFQHYSSGVIGSGCGASLDHAVTAVGYRTDNSVIVKNSWGTTWGDHGYVYISMNSAYNNGLGACGVLAQPAYPN